MWCYALFMFPLSYLLKLSVKKQVILRSEKGMLTVSSDFVKPKKFDDLPCDINFLSNWHILSICRKPRDVHDQVTKSNETGSGFKWKFSGSCDKMALCCSTLTATERVMKPE